MSPIQYQKHLRLQEARLETLLDAGAVVMSLQNGVENAAAARAG